MGFYFNWEVPLYRKSHRAPSYAENRLPETRNARTILGVTPAYSPVNPFVWSKSLNIFKDPCFWNCATLRHDMKPAVHVNEPFNVAGPKKIFSFCNFVFTYGLMWVEFFKMFIFILARVIYDFVWMRVYIENNKKKIFCVYTVYICKKFM